MLETLCTQLNEKSFNFGSLSVMKKYYTGFTLVELMITVAVLAIVLSVGVPSFGEIIKDSRISAATSCFTGALHAARSEAVKRSTNVTVCPYGDDNSCGTNWSNGALVFSEGRTAPTTPDLDAAMLEADSQVIRVCKLSSSDLTINALGSSDRTVASAAARSFIRYSRKGRANWSLGYFSICDDRSSEHWSASNINLSGDIRTARLASDGHAVVDAFNRKIESC